MTNVLIQIAKVLSVVFGFFGALSLVRSLSSAFHWHMGFIYPIWLNFGFVISLLILCAAMAAFTYCVWRTKKMNLPYRRIDYSLLLLLCGVGIYICYDMLLGRMLTPWEIITGIGMPDRPIPAGVFVSINLAYFQTHIIFLPIIAYGLALFAFGELIARIRDATLVSTLYWLAFFKLYPIWRPLGFLAALLLASQLLLLAFFLPALIGLVSILVTSGILTYFVVSIIGLSREYEKTNVEKIRAERFKSELITNVSHDIRTPLTSIINYVDLLKGEELHGQAADYVQVLDKKSARLKVLIDDLMEASKAGTGNLKVDMQKIDLGELVGQVAGEFEDDLAGKALALVIRQPDSHPVTIHSDSRHLHRALENLFSNAAKYALEGTRVFAEIVQQDGKTQFTLQNTAQSPLELSGQDVTEQFIRGDIARQTEGSGLGLYIAKSLVELTGGELRVSILGDLFRVEIVFGIGGMS